VRSNGAHCLRSPGFGVKPQANTPSRSAKWYDPKVPVTGGPYLNSALFCEKVLREMDSVLTLVRVFDKWTVQGSSPTMPLTVIAATLHISLRSGTFRGGASVTVKPSTPSGQPMPQISFPVQFEGDEDRGVGIIAVLQLPAAEAGAYWFEISVVPDSDPSAAQILTQTPLRVVYQRMPQMPGHPNPEHQ
jgi:hypothetical protein